MADDTPEATGASAEPPESPAQPGPDVAAGPAAEPGVAAGATAGNADGEEPADEAPEPVAAPLQDLIRQERRRTTAPSPPRPSGPRCSPTARTTVSNLATALSATVDDVASAVTALEARLTGAGMSVARHHDEVWLVPRGRTPEAVAANKPLTFAEARLLRRIHRGEDVRRLLSEPDREFTPPRTTPPRPRRRPRGRSLRSPARRRVPGDCVTGHMWRIGALRVCDHRETANDTR